MDINNWKNDLLNTCSYLVPLCIGTSFHIKTFVFRKNWPYFDCTEIFDEEYDNSDSDNAGKPNTLWTGFPVGNNVTAIPVNAIQHTFLLSLFNCR